MRISAATYFKLALLLAVGLLAGCGKIGEPLPPIVRTPLGVEELRVGQEGARLVLSFPLVRSRQTRRIERIEVYRLVEEVRDPAGLPSDIFAARASVIATISADQIPVSRSTVTYVDPIEAKSLRRGIRYRYAVRVINTSGAATDFSNYALIQPLADVAAAPVELTASQQERQIVISWKAPTANFNETTPVNLAGYNIYRRVAGSDSPPLRLNNSLLKEALFQDQTFQFGTSYEYIVRAVSRPPEASPVTADGRESPVGIESDESRPLIHASKDTFPPAPPTALTVASINRLVSLFWPLNTELDVAGYNVYRAEEVDGQPPAWSRLNPQLHTSGSWRDDRVVAGRTYLYRVTAVDRAGNESQPSATVSETVNQ